LENPVDTETFLLMSLCSGEDIKRFQLTLERLCIYGEMLRYMFTFKFVKNELKERLKEKDYKK
jgi:type VI protein secretion system component Hcp